MRDFAKRKSKSKTRRRSKTKGSGFSLSWLLMPLLLCGLTIGGVYYIRTELNKNIEKQAAAPHHTKSKLPTIAKAPEPPKPTFEFYKVLPKRRMEVTAKSTIDSYNIQVATLKKNQDADRLKAELILAGFNAKVVQTAVNKQTVYRVIIGPYSNLAKAEHDVDNLKKTHHYGIIRSIH